MPLLLLGDTGDRTFSYAKDAQVMGTPMYSTGGAQVLLLALLQVQVQVQVQVLVHMRTGDKCSLQAQRCRHRNQGGSAGSPPACIIRQAT
jgi:hypothetical protein